MSVTKPTKLPRWARTVAGALAARVKEPNEGKKDVGFVAPEQPPDGYFNWLFSLIYDWLAWFLEGAEGAPEAVPGGRLTLTSGTPVTTTDVSGATTVYYTPYRHNRIPLYDGTRWLWHSFTELSQATSDSTKSPAACANNSNYDVFVWSDSGTLRATRGPAWSSDTARGTGAGTTELELFEGRWVNKVAITNGPAARRGLYVGTVRTDGSAVVNDTLAKRHMWNTYGRVARPMKAVDTTNSWTYSTATFRQANNSSANQLDYVVGLAEDQVTASVYVTCLNDSTNVPSTAGVGVDSTSANSALVFGGWSGTVAARPNHAWYRGVPGIGRHFLAWLEWATALGNTTWFGDDGGVATQAGILGEVQA